MMVAFKNGDEKQSRLRLNRNAAAIEMDLHQRLHKFLFFSNANVSVKLALDETTELNSILHDGTKMTKKFIFAHQSC